jgi:hypothetical protein
MSAMAQVRDGAKASTIVTPTTTTLEFLSPDKEIFDAAKTPYQAAIDRINLNINIPMILVDGKSDGASYSTAVYMIKAFLQDLIDEREMLIDDFVYPWYRMIAEKLYKAKPKEYAYLWNADEQDWNIPNVIFNETELKNITELIDLLKFKLQMGTYSPQSLMESMQDDYPIEKQRKEAFNDDPDWVGLNFEPGLGMGIGGKNVADADTQHSQSMELQGQQIDNQSDMQDQDHQNQMKMQKEGLKGQLQLQKQKSLLTPPGGGIKKPGVKPAAKSPGRKASPTVQPGRTAKKAAPSGSPGRPAKSGARPRSDSKDRNPRTATAIAWMEEKRGAYPGRASRAERGQATSAYIDRPPTPGRTPKPDNISD